MWKFIKGLWAAVVSILLIVCLLVGHGIISIADYHSKYIIEHHKIIKDQQEIIKMLYERIQQLEEQPKHKYLI
jgi:predicted PurR-regulated permease PerM